MSIAAYEFSDTHLKTIVAVVGLGLLGEEVSRQLGKHCKRIKLTEQHEAQWISPNPLLLQLMHLVDSNTADKFEIVWCAGRGGFNASEEQIDAEVEFYSALLQRLFAQLTSTSKQCQLTVNLLSTAGGIYEHSGFVDSLDGISAQRAYALGKLKQEKLLEDLAIQHRVYRISSVYGLNKLGGRVGLISALFKGARQRTPVTIYAGADTLRDYIFSPDVARYVVKQILNNADTSMKLLASGRATSISTLINYVNNITGQRVNTSYRYEQRNQLNIAFSKKLIDPQLSLTSLEEGLRLVNKNLLVSSY